MAKMDLAHRETDKLIEDLEKRIDETYARAARETQAKLDKYLKSFEKKDAEKKKLVDSKQMKQSEYEKWRIGQIMTGKRWEEMSRTLATDLAHADYIAQKITQDSMIDAYALNHNYATYEVEKGSMVDTSYTMYDHDTAERLIAKEPQLLPKASEKTEQKIREGKLIRWNQQKITSEVTQSILQGESVDKMARRMRNVTDMDRRASIRNARTSMTGAQNAGRQDSYERAQEMGIDTEKQWMAVMDDRTRHWHVELDGEHVPVDEPFNNEYGDIKYPGDPDADPANVYNCRCTMICRIKGFEKDFTDRTNEALGDMSYEEWKHAKDRTPVELPKGEKREIFILKENDFVPAQSISEAEEYAKNRFTSGGFNLTGKEVSFKGIDVDIANRINQRLNDLYEQFNLPKLSSLESYGKANKKAWNSNPDAPMFTTNFGNFGLNNTLLKNEKTIKQYVKEGNDSFRFVMENIDALSGEKREIAEAYRIAGKSLVGDSIEDMVTHEIGHHLSYIPDVNKVLSEIKSDTNWKETAEHLSGYANHSFGEYIAESFNAYCRGESESLQSEMVEVFESLRRK